MLDGLLSGRVNRAVTGTEGTGEPPADDRFVEEHRPLVTSIAHKLRVELDLQCELDDLLAYGFRGLVEARARYDASRGVQFNTFAYYRIRGAIMDGIRQMAWLPRRAWAKLRVAEATDAVAEEVGQGRAANPTGRADVGGTAEALDGVLARITSAYVAAATGQDEQMAERGSPEQTLLGGEQRARVRAALSELPERERALVQGFYFDGRRFDEIATELGISKSWASRLHSKALDRLREHLAEI